jgi:hypothetical protein
LAFWFAGLNSFLDDERPQDVLASDPESAIAAAKDEMAELHHPKNSSYLTKVRQFRGVFSLGAG